MRRIAIALIAAACLAVVPPIGPSPAHAATPIDVVAIAALPDGDGYVIVESDGVVWAYGEATDLGDLAELDLIEPIVGAAMTPTGDGYWLVASDGGVFAFGDAGFFGSTGGLALVEPVVGMASTPSGDGYWLVASDGGVFAFGDAEFFGSTGDLELDLPVMSIAPTDTGRGYRLLAIDGGEFDFGDAEYIGSNASRRVRFSAAAVTSSGDGHWMVTAAGQLQQSGLAPRLGAPVAGPPTADVPLEEADLGFETIGIFDEPIAIRSRPGDATGIYIAERSGRIVRYDMDSSVRTTLLDMSNLTATDSERGLLGFDFSPDGSKVYLDHTNLAGSVELAEYDLSVSPPARRLLLSIPQPFANHNGGDVHVTDDGMVWASSGDGGSGGDPANNSQNRSNLLGTIYRIDPTPATGAEYSVPGTNPFVGEAGVRPEIWAYGLRNPWRFSFDSATGDLWIADVGQGSREEINLERSGSEGGLNYGWKRWEGDVRFSDVEATDPVFPIHTYGHDDGCSITGGVVSRGGLDVLEGVYLFSDYCSGVISGLQLVGGDAVSVVDLGLRAPGAVAFGADPNGDVIVALLGGGVRRIVQN